MREKNNKRYNQQFDRLSNRIDLVSALLMSLLVLIVLIEIFGRYFFNHPFSFTNEITMLIFPWIVFLSMISVTHHKEHIGLVFIVNKMPEKTRYILFIAKEIITMFFILFMLIGTIRLSIAVSNQMIGTLYMSKTFYYLSLDVSFAIILYMKIMEVIAIFKGRDGSKR